MSETKIGSKENRRARPDGDLEKQLDRVLKWMHRSCSLFDIGDEDEAIQLALQMRKLLYDRGSSKSLLRQLGMKDEMMFVNSALYPEKWREILGSVAAEHGMVGAISQVLSLTDIKPGENGVGKFTAPLSKPYFDPADPFQAACPMVQRFNEWWTTPVIDTSNRRCFSRADLIMIIADQENGAHVDPELDGDFQDLCVDNLGIQSVWHDKPFSVLPDVAAEVRKSLPYTSVRQVAWEVLTSIERWIARPAPGQFLLAKPFERKVALRWQQMQPMVWGEPADVDIPPQ